MEGITVVRDPISIIHIDEIAENIQCEQGNKSDHRKTAFRQD